MFNVKESQKLVIPFTPPFTINFKKLKKINLKKFLEKSVDVIITRQYDF